MRPMTVSLSKRTLYGVYKCYNEVLIHRKYKTTEVRASNDRVKMRLQCSARTCGDQKNSSKQSDIPSLTQSSSSVPAIQFIHILNKFSLTYGASPAVY